MTLLQIIGRIRTLALAHKQVRRFTTGAASDFFADHTAKFPACCLQYTDAIVNVAQGGFMSVTFRMFLLDLVHVSEGTKANEDDVLSDTLSILLDLVAQMNSYNDWRFLSDSQLQAVTEYDNDLSGGWYIDFTIKVPFAQNICEVPSELAGEDPETDNLVFDYRYTADGSEGSTLTIPELLGKRLILITREQAQIYKVSNLPDSAEYTWDNVSIGLGAVVNPGERFLILYTNY